MTNIVDMLAASQYGMTRTAAHKAKVCVQCKAPAIDFRDTLSVKEYTLSGFCQDCQDNFFEEYDEQAQALDNF